LEAETYARQRVCDIRREGSWFVATRTATKIASRKPRRRSRRAIG